MNNEQIDNTSYYELPGGGQLEDFIAAYGLSFAVGSALKYLWRAGKKDGEAAEKDLAKARHFIEFEARCLGCEAADVKRFVRFLLEEARSCRFNVFMANPISRIKPEKMLVHYWRAVSKHPYFCDRVIDNFGRGPHAKLLAKIMKKELDLRRLLVKREADCEMLTPATLLRCEFAEAMEAYARGDTAAAVDECHDCIAVLLRMIDVLEGRQPLGKPKDGTEAAE